MIESQMQVVQANPVAELFFIVKRSWLWLLVFAAIGTVGALYWQKQQVPQAYASANFSLNPARVQYLSSLYAQMPPNSTLLLGALEVDEVSRFSVMMDEPALWQRLFSRPEVCAFADLCAKSAEDIERLTSYWRPRLQFEHKRRGNLLFVKVRADDAAKAQVILEQAVQQAEALELAQKLAQSEAQIQSLNQNVAAATSVGERTELTALLDKAQAVASLWRQQTYHAMVPVGAVQVKPAKSRSTAIAATVGALLGALVGLMLALVVVRR